MYVARLMQQVVIFAMSFVYLLIIYCVTCVMYVLYVMNDITLEIMLFILSHIMSLLLL